MNEEDRAIEWSARRRHRTFLVGGVLGAVVALVALVALVAMLLGLNWAAGFLGSSAVLSVMMLLRWRGERREARDRIGSFL